MSAQERKDDAAPAEGLACPSAPATVGAKLFGVVQEDGRVGIFGKALTVDEAFLEKARQGRAPEKRFRFSSPCLKDGCKQWSDGQCGVIRRVLEAVALDEGEAPTAEAELADESALQPCAIRGRCRWFAERGRAACRICPEVVTDTRVA